MRAITHHQPPAALVALGGEPGDVVIDLGLQRFSQHPPGTLTDDLIDQRPSTAGVISIIGSRNYGEHGSCLPDQRCSAGLA
jgi:hypothetical protein